MTKKNKPNSPQHKIDTAALLANVDIVQVIDARVPLKKNGAEYEACCPFHNESTPSFKVSPAKQFYHCFGCGANGDAIKFLMEHSGLSFVDACRELGADVPESDGTQPTIAPAKRAPMPRKAAKKVTEWQVISPVPQEAPEPPVAHPVRGKPSARWTYLDADGGVFGYICRFEKSTGGKEIASLSYCRHPDTGKMSWEWVSFAKPRPLYGLDRLAAKPEATVLLVEGEKCVDAAQAELPDMVVVSWPGGGKAIEKINWYPLAGRKVIAWADCDSKHERITPAEKAAGILQISKPLLPVDEQPGVMAMTAVAKHALDLGCEWFDVTIPAPGDKPDGWDIADAIAEGLKGEALAEHIRNNITARSAAPPETESTPTQASAGKERKNPFIPDLVFRQGDVAPVLSNVYQILAHDPKWRGVLAYDEMSLCTVKRKAPPFAEGRVGEWDSQDDSRTAMWLTREYGCAPSSAMVAEAVEVLARAHAWHPVRTWLRSLEWDGKPRLNYWLRDYLGAKHSPYSTRVGAWWIMGAVVRVLRPGAKFDYCLVLSGKQGKGKSTVFEIIGGEWYGDTELDLQSKDAMSGLRGKMIYEFPELGALARSEERRQKSFLSRRIDEYRPVYGRREIKAPRQVVFGGSTNEHEWNKDPTGGRRFWPIDCLLEIINTEGLREVRDQLFAEALFRVEDGERYWPTADEQRKYFDEEQLAVEMQDSLVDAMHDWVYSRVTEFSKYEIATDCLKMDASKLTPNMDTRIGIALRKLGCTRIEKRNGMTRYVYKPPTKNEAESNGQQEQQESEGYRAQF